ncbi:SIMPL domain-containing protein [Actinoplanes sp. NPDC049802]|uniref:SIMPL domain-containing protein n=1 Tax=Actinoplanes sp. NPDC049802 TaxID=3154742 RepID=UPI0033FD7E62
MEKTIVTVHGEARREVPPEQAVFTVTVSAVDRDKAALVARINQRATETAALLDRFAQAVERRETTGLQMNPEYDRRGKRAEAYRGSISTTVTVTDFESLGELLYRLAGEDLVSISGPWWQLRPGNRAGADVRREAVADALARAREYAEAVGSELDRIVEIADADAAGGHPVMRSAAFAIGAAEDTGGFDLSPETQSVEARVLLRVTITEPTLPGA